MRVFRNLFIALTLCLLFGCDVMPPASIPADTRVQHRDDTQKIYQSFKKQESGIFVESKGRVVRILPDDLDGKRHQRFLLELLNGQTLLIAHNIDLAPRVNSLNVGDEVYFCGDYEFSSQGGKVHYTHHDPNRRRIGGWLEHEGIKYQ